MTIPVTGATGNVGRNVVDRLVRTGATVRALTRDPAAARLPTGVEVARGDLADPATLGDALRGVERMFPFPVPETARHVARQAREAGVSHVVVLSSAAVTADYDTSFHLPVEQAVEQA
ncbi:SDR family oxidoreductase [Streptosporangium lutulentum]